MIYVVSVQSTATRNFTCLTPTVHWWSTSQQRPNADCMYALSSCSVQHGTPSIPSTVCGGTALSIDCSSGQLCQK